MRYRVMVSRVQVAERYVRAVDEQDAARKVQEELDRPYSFLGAWRTVDTDLDVVEAESPLEKALCRWPNIGAAPGCRRFTP